MEYPIGQNTVSSAIPVRTQITSGAYLRMERVGSAPIRIVDRGHLVPDRRRGCFSRSGGLG